MAPNRRGPDKHKRKRAAATFKQNAATQKRRHQNKLATAAEGTASLDVFGIRRTKEGEPEDTGSGVVDDTAAAAADDNDDDKEQDDVRNEVGAPPHRNEIPVETVEDDDGGHLAGSGSQQNVTNFSSNIPQTGGCIPCTPSVFNPPPVVAEIDADDDDIDLDEDEDDEEIGGGASKKKPPRQKRTDPRWKYMEAIQMRLRLETMECRFVSILF